jgi:hypothetical protein
LELPKSPARPNDFNAPKLELLLLVIGEDSFLAGFTRKDLSLRDNTGMNELSAINVNIVKEQFGNFKTLSALKTKILTVK